MACALLATTSDLEDVQRPAQSGAVAPFVPRADEPAEEDLRAFAAMSAVALLPRIIGSGERQKALVPQADEPAEEDLRAFAAMSAVALLPRVIGSLEQRKGLEGENVFHALLEEHLGGVFKRLTVHGPDHFVKVGDRLLVFEDKTSEHFTTGDKEKQGRELDGRLKKSATTHGRQGTLEHTNRHVLRLIDRAEKRGDDTALEQAVEILEAFESDKVAHFGVALNPVTDSFDIYPLDDDGRPQPLPCRLW